MSRRAGPGPGARARRGPIRSLARGIASFADDSAAQLVFGAAASMVAVGAVFYRFVEDLSWIDAVYFCVIALTTVGFGDIAPTTTAGKVFTMVYVVLGVGVFVALVTTMAHHLLEARRPEPDDPDGRPSPE